MHFQNKKFKLTRFFSISSLIGVGVIAVALVWLHRAVAQRHLIAQENQANAELTRAFFNALMPRHAPLLAKGNQPPKSAVDYAESLKLLDADVRVLRHGLKVAKIKIYSAEGRTIFSTDPAQIGEDKRASPGVKAALSGNEISHLTHRGQFDTFEGTIANRDLIATYVPARLTADGTVQGVFEVYSDVTELLAQQALEARQMALAIVGMLALLYGFLLLVVRRADHYIAFQERAGDEQAALAHHQAKHDHLTGLPNRAYFLDYAAQRLHAAQRTQSKLALLFLDLDHFKTVNDSLGHEGGDRLLKAVAERLAVGLRDSDRLFRMGGDEFTILLPKVSAQEDAVLVAQRVSNALFVPIKLDGRDLTIGVTIGVAIYPEDGQTVEDLLKNADAAMYSAKASGRGTHAAYAPSMNQAATGRLAYIEAVHSGFRDAEMCLYFQPIFSASNGEVTSVEALIRWQRPEVGLVLPGEFLGTLEESGFIHYLGEWVLRGACECVVKLRGRFADLPVAVNISPAQFVHADFFSMVTRVLAEVGLDPSRLIIEVTENGLLRHTLQTQQTIAALRKPGVRIAIDDFGTGYSSLSYLRTLEVDLLKIDRSFCEHVDTDERDFAIVKSICEVAKVLGLAVVAEGIETARQAECLKLIGCDGLQGFHFAKPLPALELARLLDEGAIETSALKPTLA